MPVCSSSESGVPIESSSPTRPPSCRPATRWRSPGAVSCWWRESMNNGSPSGKSTTPELLDVSAEVLDVVVTSAEIDGRTLADLAREEFGAQRLHASDRARRDARAYLPGDAACIAATSLTLVGPSGGSRDAVSRLGVPDRATDVTDMVLVAFGIVAGRARRHPGAEAGRNRHRVESQRRRAARRAGLRVASLHVATLLRPHSRARRCGSSSRSGSPDSSPWSGSMPDPTSCVGSAHERHEPGDRRACHGAGAACSSASPSATGCSKCTRA